MMAAGWRGTARVTRERVQWTRESDERAEHERGAGARVGEIVEAAEPLGEIEILATGA